MKHKAQTDTFVLYFMCTVGTSPYRRESPKFTKYRAIAFHTGILGQGIGGW